MVLTLALPVATQYTCCQRRLRIPRLRIQCDKYQTFFCRPELYVSLVFIFFDSWTSSAFVRGSLWLNLWLSLVGSLCDNFSGSFWTALALSGSLTNSCSPWLAFALFCFGGPCFAFQPQSCVARNFPTLV